MNIPVDVFRITKIYSKVSDIYGLQVAHAIVIGNPKIHVIPNINVKNIQFLINRLTFTEVFTRLASNTFKNKNALLYQCSTVSI